MDTHDAVQLSQILQLSITPIAFISGVAILLLVMTNRLGRVIDRSRVLVDGAESGALTEPDAQTKANARAIAEVRILFRRARLLQLGIGLMAINVFFAVLMVAALFAMTLLEAVSSVLVLSLFGGCLSCLVASVGCFLGEIFLSIRWLELSLGRYV